MMCHDVLNMKMMHSHIVAYLSIDVVIMFKISFDAWEDVNMNMLKSELSNIELSEMS